MNRLIIFFISAALFITSCGSGTASTNGKLPPVILASTTFLADVARNVAGDRMEVDSLLPTGADPHTYQITPSDLIRVSESDILILNGLGYEHFIEPLLASADGERQIISASSGLTARAGDDPHMWMDPVLMIAYVENIRAGLEQADPAGADAYNTNAAEYVEVLKDLDAWINLQTAEIPKEKRLLVTNHEALGYFAERYGFTIVGTVIESFSSDAAPSAQQMAALIDQIKLSGARAIFLDASDNAALAEQIASETGVFVVTDLHLESLTEGAPAGTYIEMMKYNVIQIVNALK